MSINSAEYTAKSREIKKVIKQLEDDLEKLNIEYCGSKEEYDKQRWMHFRSCPRIE